MKMERKRTQGYGRTWYTRKRLGKQSSVEVGCRKTLLYVIERLHMPTYIYRHFINFVLLMLFANTVLQYIVLVFKVKKS
jgi:hypothetical protein